MLASHAVGRGFDPRPGQGRRFFSLPVPFRFTERFLHLLQGDAKTTEDKPVTISDDDDASGDEKKEKEKPAAKTADDDSDNDDPTSSLKCDPTGTCRKKLLLQNFVQLYRQSIIIIDNIQQAKY